MIVIVGAGIVGLTFAAALVKMQIPVTIVESQLPEFEWSPQQLDAKVSAINNTSRNILINLGVWSHIPADSFCPLRGMQVWDHQGGGEIHFDSAQIGQPQMGFIIENRALIKTLWQHLQGNPLVNMICPGRPLSIVRGENQVQLLLDDQTVIPTQLLVGADGSRSWVREEMGVSLKERSYQQQAIIAVVESELPHQMMARQSFLSSGPLGILPLANGHLNAIVWSNEQLNADWLLSLSSTDFNRELGLALSYRLGKMTCLTPLKVIPLIMRHAEEYVQPHLALMGDAAHTIHPLAGQGVNLGLLDAAALAQVIVQAQRKDQDIGSIRVLKNYQRWRKGNNLCMSAAMRGFKELFGFEAPWLVELRSQGLNFTNHNDWIKQALIRYATGQQGDLPELALPPMSPPSGE